MEQRAHKKPLLFPSRVASIDVGSNAIRFLAAEFESGESYVPVFTDRYPLRLGHDAFLSGRLPTKSIERAVRALEIFSGHLERLGVDRYRAVATSAVRDSENKDALLTRVREETGIEIESISGLEEARLVLISVKKRLRLGEDHWIHADLGGGSVEVSLVADSGVLWSGSYRMGAVRLLEMVAGSSDEPEKFRRLVETNLEKLHIPTSVPQKKLAGFIGTGGNIETIATLLNPGRENRVYTVDIEELDKLIERLSRMSFAERIQKLQLREDRADVILPASLVFRRLVYLTAVKKIIVPYAQLGEGVVFDLVSRS